MAKSSCKCKKAHECEECPEWIFTFADLVMLMMGFFVILWVLKPAPGKKSEAESDSMVKVVAAIREAFGYIPDPHSRDPIDLQILMNQMAKMKISGPHNGGTTNREQKGPDGTDPEVTNIRPSRHATEGGKMLFDPGSAVLSPATKSALNQVADEIRGHRNIVMVKGHTSLDDLPDNATPQQKMDFYLRRAQAAADYLTERGVEPNILRVQGCSTFEPLTQHEYTANSQSENRRVEVEVTATLVDDLQENPTTHPANNGIVVPGK